MILLVGVAAGLLSALLTGGRPSRLARVRVRTGWLALGAFLLQALIVYSAPGQPSLALLALLALTNLLALLFLYLNRSLPGMRLLGLGFLLNVLVMATNGGLMPITPQAYERAFELDPLPAGHRPARTKDVLLPRSQTFLWPLSDIFVLDQRYPLQAAFSIGDVLIAAGAALFFHRTTRPKSA